MFTQTLCMVARWPDASRSGGLPGKAEMLFNSFR